MTIRDRIGTKAFFAAVILLAASVSRAAALEVNQSELRSAGNIDAVTFENYTGPHATIDSLAGIMGIGTALGRIFTPAPDAAYSS